MVAAVREGWTAYLENPAPVNTKMHALNPSMDPATYAEIAEAQKVLIGPSPLGKMTTQRWDALAAQLKELGDIPQVMPEGQYFADL
jgi:NitT/TauT family transport system substrate-binding protein